ncbi:dihydropyrimidinase [Leptolyngbya sp. FACHB-261]|uniref:dihydropyrimidinase n=1 Tax=Leptolyngbya sp. FACHB-261 TaxID=2692806 RepID=UPI00168814AA|nr:dihydropyrimidinase [Leptolyngbya sp. FACHB-261]MBD2101842.1 dihydropyrimidinase [Leptolyngbya sp. FACHB-261]
MSVLIKNGRIITASDDYRADIFIEREQITLIGADLSQVQADTVVDATDKLVIPGGIDVHTHMELPFGGTFASDDFATGTRAAAFGGTTHIIDFAVQYRGQTLRQGLETWHKKAEGKACVDYSFHMIMTEVNPGILSEMDALIEQEGVTSFKLFMAYPGVFYLDDGEIFRVMQRAGENGGLICMHAENGIVIDVLVEQALAAGNTAPKYHALTRPSSMEGEATHRAIRLAELARTPVYIVHLSALEALQAVTEARDLGIPAHAETCPQYLFLSYDNYEEPGFDGAKYVMSPPLRPCHHQAHLWRGLQYNDLQVISTDHCPFCMKEGFQGLPRQKELGLDNFSKIPNGAPGVETRMSLIYDGGVRTGKFSLNRFVELTSTTPARIFGLWPRKGTIAVGSDADLVVFDPEARKTISASTHHMRVDYNPYEGREVQGVPTQVLSRGQLVIDGDQFVGSAGRGSFTKRGCFNYY